MKTNGMTANGLKVDRMKRRGMNTYRADKPWPALWALVIGFFMILVDSTIVSVATPNLIATLETDINSAIWVTSAYLLAYAVPLLITGRLGDRYGPKNVYLLGLVVFTLASAWCGFSTDVESLIVARVVQGLGAALMTPQTMSVITRIFPPERRGAAMGLWGSVAGVATLVGPIAGGLLVDSWGWEWIFFVNLPVGVVAFVCAVRFVPNLSTHPHKFDLLGVFLSGAGMFLLVFGIQEGQTFGWGRIAGPITVWNLIIAGVVLLAAFILWQRINRGEPLLPLKLFRDRNFSLANVAITTVGFAVISMVLPIMLYAQTVRMLSPTEAALLLAPMALVSGGLAPFVGMLVDRVNPKFIAASGLLCLAGGLFWLGSIMTADTPVWLLVCPLLVLGLANAGVWAPLSTTATRNLPRELAGAGSGVYNTTRQVGAVLGSAGIAALIQVRLAVNLPADPAGRTPSEYASGSLPEAMHAGYSAAMGQALFLPAAAAFLGVFAVLFFAKPAAHNWIAPGQENAASAGQENAASAGQENAASAAAAGTGRIDRLE